MKKVYKNTQSKRLTSKSRPKTDYRNSLFNNRVRHSLKWLISTYGICSSVWEPTLRYMRFLDHIYKHKGLQTAIERIKFDRLTVNQHLSGNPKKGIGLTHDGLPMKLYRLNLHIRERNILEIRYILTLVYGLRRFNLPLQPETKTITSKSKAGNYEWLFKHMSSFSKSLVKRLPRKEKEGNKLKFPSWQAYHLAVKSSPSGVQALVNCLQDLVSIPESLINSISVLGGEELSSNMTLLRRHALELSKVLDQPISSQKSSYRRITAVPDKEGKTRLIAAGDYFSQTCLKSIHTYFNKVLRSIPQDQTFNQSKGLAELPFNSKTTYYSYDLTAFTDRFPMRILVGLLADNFGESKALAWYDIMCGYKFDYRDPKGKLNNLRYEVGNPMGMYSSWSISTLCHHFIIYCCCQELGKSWYKAKYKMLGDDIIIFDDNLALKYQELINLIGVDIQLQKSHIGSSLFEFAKRTFTPYGEISPFPLSAILSESYSYIGFIELLKAQRERGWVPNKTILEAVFAFYFEGPFAIRQKDRYKVTSKIKELWHLAKWKEGYDGSSLDLIRQVQSRNDYPQLSCNMHKLSKDILFNCVVQCFSESASAYGEKVKSNLERALLHFTSYDDERMMLIYAHPYAYVYGKYVEEAYLSQMKAAREYEEDGLGIWSPNASVMVATETDVMFSRRAIRPIRRQTSSSTFLKKVHELCGDSITLT
jgi:hypothetical protein